MKDTIVGVYDTLETAERVRDEVKETGVSMSDIRVISPDDVRENDPVDRDSESKSVTDSISDFFTSMFGEDDEDKVGERYLDAARAGSTLVVVDIDGNDGDVDAARVTQIIEAHGSTQGGTHQRHDSSVDGDAHASASGTTDAATGGSADSASMGDKDSTTGTTSRKEPTTA